MELKTQPQKTPVANLVRNAASGVYYARVQVSGKLIWKTPKTDRMSVAKLRLGDFLKEQKPPRGVNPSHCSWKNDFGDAPATCQQQLQNAQHLRPNARLYRQKNIKALLKSWPEMNDTDARKIPANDCQERASRFARGYSPAAFNNTAGALRQVIEVAIKAGAR